MKPDICIHHHPCMDGWTAAWAVWKRWPDIEFVEGQYKPNQPLPDVAGKHVLIVDFSYPEAAMRELAATAASITVLDHHETAERNLTTLLEEGVIAGEFDMTRSGAMMTWEYIWPKDQVNPFDECDGAELHPATTGYLPYVVQFVQDRDIWLWALEHSHEVNAYIQSVPLTFAAWDKLAADLEDEDGFNRICHVGAALVQRQNTEIATTIKATRRRMIIGGYDVPVCNLPYQMASEAGNILCKGEPFAATYFDAADGTRSFSLRSDKDDPEAANVAKIAESFGGGGHKNASGFRRPGGWEGDMRPHPAFRSDA